jgi:hypothetical protein
MSAFGPSSSPRLFGTVLTLAFAVALLPGYAKQAAAQMPPKDSEEAVTATGALKADGLAETRTTGAEPVIIDRPLGAEQLAEVRNSIDPLVEEITNVPSEVGAGKRYPTFADYWDSERSLRLGQLVIVSQEGLKDAIETVLNSPSTTSRLGAGALESAREAKATERELQTLADHYAAGDIRRLFVGDLNSAAHRIGRKGGEGTSKVPPLLRALSTSDDELVRERVAKEVREILDRQKVLLQMLEGEGTGDGVNRKIGRQLGRTRSAPVIAAWEAMTVEQRLHAQRAYLQGRSVKTETDATIQAATDLKAEEQRHRQDLKMAYSETMDRLTSAGFSRNDAYNAGAMQNDLDLLRQHEAGLIAGDPEILLREFQKLSLIEIQEDAIVLQATRDGADWMLDMISSLRTLEALRPEAWGQQQFFAELRAYAIETDLSRKKEKLKFLEKAGVDGDRLGQAASAFITLNNRGCLGVIGEVPEQRQTRLLSELRAASLVPRNP